MRSVRGAHTEPERYLRSALHRRGFRFRVCAQGVTGKPDLVFRRWKLAVFVDGDFWHGWRFPLWRDALPPYWQKKIERNRRRDRSNVGKLRRQGWKVLRIWGHQVNRDLESVLIKVERALKRGAFASSRSRRSAPKRRRATVKKPAAM